MDNSQPFHSPHYKAKSAWPVPTRSSSIILSQPLDDHRTPMLSSATPFSRSRSNEEEKSTDRPLSPEMHRTPPKKESIQNKTIHIDDKENDEPKEAEDCLFCQGSMTEGGLHQISCLKCGHIAGHSCLERWTKKEKRCPTCNGKASKNDIRKIFGLKTMIVADGSRDYDGAMRQLRAEQQARTVAEISRDQLSKDMQHLKTRGARLSAENTSLREEVAQLKRALAQKNIEKITEMSEKKEKDMNESVITSQSPQKDSFIDLQRCRGLIYEGSTPVPPPQNAFFKENSQEGSQMNATQVKMNHRYKMTFSTDFEAARVLDWNAHEGHLFVSSSQNGVYGLTKISALDPKNTDFMPLHDKQIMDLKIDPFGNGLVLSTSPDRSLRLSCPKNKTSVLKIKLKDISQSCEWNRDDPNQVFCGLGSGIALFDVRKSDTHLQLMSGIDGAKYFHCMRYVRDARRRGVAVPAIFGGSQLNSYRGLYAASAGGINFWDADDHWGTSSHVPARGFCTSLSFDPISGYFLASYRRTLAYTKPSHIVYEQTSQGHIRELRTVHSEQEFQVERGLHMTRTNIFTLSSHHTDDPSPIPTRIVAATTDEITNHVLLWDASHGTAVQKLPAHPSRVLELRHFGDASMDFFASLSEKKLDVYKLFHMKRPNFQRGHRNNCITYILSLDGDMHHLILKIIWPGDCRYQSTRPAGLTGTENLQVQVSVALLTKQASSSDVRLCRISKQVSTMQLLRKHHSCSGRFRNTLPGAVDNTNRLVCGPLVVTRDNNMNRLSILLVALLALASARNVYIDGYIGACSNSGFRVVAIVTPINHCSTTTLSNGNTVSVVSLLNATTFQTQQYNGATCTGSFNITQSLAVNACVNGPVQQGQQVFLFVNTTATGFAKAPVAADTVTTQYTNSFCNSSVTGITVTYGVQSTCNPSSVNRTCKVDANINTLYSTDACGNEAIAAISLDENFAAPTTASTTGTNPTSTNGATTGATNGATTGATTGTAGTNTGTKTGSASTLFISAFVMVAVAALVC
ncbi:e3 ubiquitin-protein ligase RFWD3-like [Planoprotostelium fungivorum]|uniref:RING-type E3 ubiquitin transferase n=1 Tax=Planoprotostelium fungivorum TaxID=1890364 RepID=A0A2P6NRS7_9EUKA|nr:e3 ubiquitin-protein ligase RFWD3-like [Planoprotostelium fungivorum]